MKFVNSVFLVLFIAMVGCGKDTTNYVGVTPTVTTVVSTSVSVQSLVAQENAYLESVGQHDLLPGLACTLYTVPTTTTSILSETGLVNIATFPYVGAFNQQNSNVTTGLNILPTALQPVYQTWISVQCTGYMVSLDDNYHEFTLTSDDGSLLYINGSLVVNDDGLHSSQTVNGVKLMTEGVVSVQVKYFQGAGEQSLILSEDGTLMDGSVFFH